MKVVILIPAYNSAATLGDVLSKILSRHSEQDVLVVDDGSSDNTVGIAKKHGVQLVSHSENRGKGAALRTGFVRAIELKADAVLTLDADGQHDPVYMPKFLDAMQRSSLDIIVGSRMRDLKSMPWDRQFSNKVTSKIMSARCRQKIEDGQCGYRLIRTDVLKKIELTTRHFETEAEILYKASLHGFKIGFVPISTIYNQAGSSIRRGIDTLRFICLFFRSFFW